MGAGTEVTIKVKDTAPMSLTKTLKLSGRPELAFLKTEAARSATRCGLDRVQDGEQDCSWGGRTSWWHW